MTKEDKLLYWVHRIGADTDLSNGLEHLVVEQLDKLEISENYIACQALMDSLTTHRTQHTGI